MKHLILILAAIANTTLAASQTISPELIGSAGNSFKNTTYILDWSIGESITATYNSVSYEITQGFHQGNYDITAIKVLAEEEININVYPNPATNFITVDMGEFESSKNNNILIITNMNGELLLQEQIQQTKKQINFSAFPSGIYFLGIKQDNKMIKNFKIVKN